MQNRKLSDYEPHFISKMQNIIKKLKLEMKYAEFNIDYNKKEFLNPHANRSNYNVYSFV